MSGCRTRNRLPGHYYDAIVLFEPYVSPATGNTFERCYSAEADKEQFTFGEICLCDGPKFTQGDVCFNPANVANIEIDVISQILERMKGLQKIKDSKIKEVTA